jgi:hypothetical protein
VKLWLDYRTICDALIIGDRGTLAKEKETGAPSESAESIKVMLLLVFVPSKEERSTQRERGGNEGEALVRFPVCAVLID